MLQTKEKGAVYSNFAEIDERRKLAKQGIGTGYEGCELVTVYTDDPDCDYQSWKEFCIHAIDAIGLDTFCHISDFTKQEIFEALTYKDRYSLFWFDEIAKPFFGGVTGGLR